MAVASSVFASLCSNKMSLPDRPPVHRLPQWTALHEHAHRLQPQRIATLFADDAQRAASFSLEVDGLLFDYAKQQIDDAARAALLDLAHARALDSGIEALFDGALLNASEHRPALHMALRGSARAPAADAVRLTESQARLDAFVQRFGAGELRGASNELFDTVVNLGIGGSDLGPRMACEALRTGRRPADAVPLHIHFVANIDPRELDACLARLDPARTLFLVSSKSFTTLETLANARAARDWLRAGLGEAGHDLARLARHFYAITQAPQAAVDFGFRLEQVFWLPAWVGGRYSVWSAISLPLRLALGEERFGSFLAGARAMDEHFRSAPLAYNLPALLGLCGLWNINFLGIENLAVLPYAHGLRSFPAWLQQLDMESNGKHCQPDGTPLEVATAPIVWGGAGTPGQHAFHQLLYQGTRRSALEFIVPVGNDDPRQVALVDNALAQAAALMQGRNLDEALALTHGDAVTAAQRVCPANHPGSLLLLPELSPFTLGQLMAAYEHKVFVQGWIWGINSFDQFGVELGKEMAHAITQGDRGACDPSTQRLMATVAAWRQR